MGNEGGTSQDPCSDIYSGPRAFSELWMTPWGWTKEFPQDFQEQDAAAKVACDALKAVHGTTCDYGSIANIIYVSSGSSADWAYGKANITYSYGVELRDKGQNGFLLPASEIIPSGEETLAAILALANYV